MFVWYLIIILVFILMSFCALAPFFYKWNKSIPTKEEEEAQERLKVAPTRVKQACKYPCPHCGNMVLPDKDGMDVRCYKCGHLWHPDYILTVYEDEYL